MEGNPYGLESKGLAQESALSPPGRCCKVSFPVSLKQWPYDFFQCHLIYSFVCKNR